MVEIAARMSSKGQLTVPKAVRDALGIGEGDNVVFRVEGNRAVLARTPDFLALAGTFNVPASRRNAARSPSVLASSAALSSSSPASRRRPACCIRD